MASIDGMKVLLAGESWFTSMTHAKGFADFTTAHYEEGQAPLQHALEQAGCQFDFLPNHRAVEEFPWTAEDLGVYDVVIFSDLPADTLLLHPKTFSGGERTPNRLNAVAEFVQAGGGFLMVGGYMSFSGIEAKAGYHNTCIPELLPVDLLPYDDRVETPEGVTPEPALEHPILEGIEGPWPWFLGYNRTVAKSGAQVLVEAGNDPFLAIHDVGSGRAGAFASDCSPHWGSPDFLDWPFYGQMWSQLVGWLAGR
ncbi:MAG: cytoplasmic protein [Nitriliruptoraceae bacterium]|nr:cytoplasmic protein [Nitriliruptoraceae bacterium]